MPGQSNNTTILTADNQLIITQNEQTTELNDIEQAILSLKAVIASSGGNGGNSVSGDGPTGIQDMIGIDPLEDFTQEQSNNRCTIANFIFDGLYGCADELGDGPLQGLTTLAAAITTGIPIQVLVATVFVGSPVILGVAAGVLVGAIAAYIASSGDFADIADEMLEQKQAIINDLYRSKDVYEAKAAFVDNCSGLSSPNKMLLGLLCGTDILKVLFISNFEVPIGYSPSSACQETAVLELSNLTYTGPVGGEAHLVEGGVSGCSGTEERYTTYGVADCQLTLDITGLVGGERQITMTYAVYDGLNSHSMVLKDGSDQVQSTATGCNVTLQLVLERDFTHPQIVLTCNHANGVDFWPWSIEAA